MCSHHHQLPEGRSSFPLVIQHNLGCTPHNTADIYIAMRGVLAGALPFEVLQNMLLPTYAACLKQSAEALVRYGHTKSLVVANVHPMQITPVWTAAAEQIPLPDGGVELKHNISLLVRSLNDMIRRDVADLAASYKRAKISVGAVGR